MLKVSAMQTTIIRCRKGNFSSGVYTGAIQQAVASTEFLMSELENCAIQ